MELRSKKLISILLFLILKISQLGLQTFASVKSYFNLIEDSILFFVFLLHIILMLKNFVFCLCHFKEKLRSKTKEKILLVVFICVYLLIVGFYINHFLLAPVLIPNKYSELDSYGEENQVIVIAADSKEPSIHYSSINKENSSARKNNILGIIKKNLTDRHLSYFYGTIYNVAIILLQMILYIIMKYLKKINTLLDQESAINSRADTQSLVASERSSQLSLEENLNEGRRDGDEHAKEEKKELKSDSFIESIKGKDLLEAKTQEDLIEALTKEDFIEVVTHNGK